MINYAPSDGWKPIPRSFAEHQAALFREPSASVTTSDVATASPAPKPSINPFNPSQ